MCNIKQQIASMEINRHRKNSKSFYSQSNNLSIAKSKKTQNDNH